MIESNDEHGAEYHLRKAGQLFRAEAGRAARAEHDVAHLREMLAKAREELATMCAERATIDNSDGTETKLLPVTYPKGLDVECARSPKRGDRYFGDGEQFTSVDDHHQARIRLIIRPAPKPPEPVTWEASVCDGIWIAHDSHLVHSGSNTCFMWDGALTLMPGINKPAVLGRYRFENGVGTLIEESKQ